MRFLVLTGAWILGVSPLSSQLLTTRISFEDWGLRSMSDIRFGRLSVIHERTGDRLSVSTLRAHPLFTPRTSPKSSPATQSPFLIVSHFDGGVRNSLGGAFNSFSRQPSLATAEIFGRAGARPALRLEFDKRATGFCGMWVHLFNSFAPLEARVYLDATAFSFLSFWVRGSAREDIRLRIADATWELKEDAVEVGEVDKFLPSGSISTEWQRVVVPLKMFPSEIRKSHLATISFEAASGKGFLEVKTLAFCRDSASLPPLPPPQQVTEEHRMFDKALWVWNTDEIFKDVAKKKKFFDLLIKQGFNHVFLGLPYRLSSSRDSGIVLNENRFRLMLARLNKMAIKVHALIGDKDFIYPEQRAFVNATLQNVIAFNARSKPGEGFYGVHLDVEPYLLPGFNGSRQQWILNHFVELLDHAASIAKRANLFIGADIPFWLDIPDEFTGDYLRVNLNGASMRIIDHLIDILDLTVLMTYRTVADGADGVIMHSSDEIEYAEKAGKLILLGLETHPLPDEDAMTFNGEPQQGIPDDERAAFVALAPAGDSAIVWLIRPGELAIFRNSLKSSNVPDSSVACWSVSRTLSVRGDKLSFASHGLPELERVIGQSQAALKTMKSFRGFAIHHFESFLPMFERSTR